MSFFARFIMLALLLAGGLMSASSMAQATDELVQITLGKGDMVRVEGDVSDILVADPKVADVSAVQANQLYIVGASIGNTNIMALDQEGNVLKRLNVHVRVDTAAIESMLRKLFPNEDHVKVTTIGNKLALSGIVSTPTVAQKIVKLVAAHIGDSQKKSGGSADAMIENLLEVRGEQQVMLRVRIVEMNRGILKELGLETSANDLEEGAASLFGRLPPTSRDSLSGFLQNNTRTGLSADPFGIAGLIYDTGIGGIGQLQFLLNALERDNLANILAEPNLTAISGEQAGFLAGGEFPVPVGRDREGNIIVEYKEFGVSLNFKPLVLSEDRISLQLSTEVSSLNRTQGITLEEIQIPGLDVRRASTTVEINSGGSLMMAGLLKSDNIKGLSGLPGIKDTPIIGDLVKSQSFQRSESELVVIVTPYLVQPFADDSQAKAVDYTPSKDLPPPPPAAFVPADKGKRKDLDTLPNIDDQAVNAPAPVRNNTALSKVFSRNLKKIYGDRVGNIPKDDKSYGYIWE
jgi:pilus assembly protein CpaC